VSKLDASPLDSFEVGEHPGPGGGRVQPVQGAPDARTRDARQAAAEAGLHLVRHLPGLVPQQEPRRRQLHVQAGGKALPCGEGPAERRPRQGQDAILAKQEPFRRTASPGEQDGAHHWESFASVMESRKNVRVLFLKVQKATTATFPPTRENESGLIVRLVRAPSPDR